MTTQETEPDPPARAGGSPTEAWGSRGSPWRGALAAAGLEGPLAGGPPGGHHQPHHGAHRPRAGSFRLHNYHHTYGGKRRRTEEPLNETERGELQRAGLKLNIQKAKIRASGPITSRQVDGETIATVTTLFLGSKITVNGDYSHEIKMLTPWKKSYDQPRQHSKKQRHYFTNKGLSGQGYGFSSSHVWM